MIQLRSASRRVFAILLMHVFAFAQAPGSLDRKTSADILVRITSQDDRAFTEQVRVELVNDSDVPVEENFCDSQGHVTFHLTAPGMYHVRVSGTNIQPATSDVIRVDEMDHSKTVFVRVKPKTDATPEAAKKQPNRQVTSATDLRVPPDARKAFRKGVEAWEHNDLPKAAEYFEQATVLYPQYDTAFNNLGVMYYQTNQMQKARAAFERSVALNDRNADADRNLSRMLIGEGDCARAEQLLKKSLMVEPLNPVTLTLIAVAEIQTGDDDGALMNARKVHSLPHEGYAVVHYVAGQAWEHRGQPQNATSEYQTYLQESPGGPEAGQVRSALNRLTATNRPNFQ